MEPLDEHNERPGSAAAINPLYQPDNRSGVEAGFRLLFDELQHNFITRSRKDIAIELKKIENRSTLLQDKINSLHNEVDRLSAIDLDTELKKMQSNVDHIFHSVNDIAAAVDKNFSDINGALTATYQLINKHADDTARQMTKIEEVVNQNAMALEHKLQTLQEQNSVLRRSARRNAVILILGIIALAGLMAYMIAYQAGIRM